MVPLVQLSHAANNFNIMRLLAAWAVLYSHSFALYGEGQELFVGWDFTPASALGLNVFFVISGYLIAASWQSQPHIAPFIAKRLLRLIPALLVVTLLSIFLLGPLVTHLPMSDYFAHEDTWKYLRNIVIFPMRYVLPGVFESVPYANIVNGSLWSLKVELRCYLLLGFLGVIGLLRPRLLLAFAVASLITYGALVAYAELFPKRFWGFKYTNVLTNSRWYFSFFAGAVFYLWRDHIPLTKSLFALSILAYVISWYMPIAGHVLPIFCLPYIILYIGLKTPSISHILRGHDISYGVYIYAFPVQQLYMHSIGKDWGMAGFIITATLCSLLCGWLSWRYVEQPSLRLKRYLPAVRPQSDL